MSSLNDGNKIQQNNRTTRHTGHCIEISDAVTDSRLECHLLADGRGLPAPTPPEPEGPTMPTEALLRWWSAATPLLSAEGDEIVYTSSGGAYTAGTVHGLDAITGADATAVLKGASPYGAVPEIPEGPGDIGPAGDFVIYQMFSGVLNTDDEVYGGGLSDGDTTDLLIAYWDESSDPDTGVYNINLAANLVPNTAYVLSIEFDASLDLARAGVNGVFGDWELAHFNGAAVFADHHILSPWEEGIEDIWITDSLVYGGVLYDQDVVDWLLSRTS